MRECPTCHTVDHPSWRPPPHYPDLDYCRFDEFTEIQPELAQKLMPKFTVEDEIYVYRRSATGKYVYRVWKPIFRAWGAEGWSHFRKTKMYDSAGRLRRESWQKIMRIINQDQAYRRKHKDDLELYLGKGETMKAVAKPETSSPPNPVST